MNRLSPTVQPEFAEPVSQSRKRHDAPHGQHYAFVHQPSALALPLPAFPAGLGLLIHAYQAGAGRGSQRLFDECGPRLLAVITRSIKPSLRLHCDPEGLLSKLFMKIHAARFSDEVLASNDHCWATLKTMARNVVRSAIKKLRAKRRLPVELQVALQCAASGFSRRENPEDQSMAKEEAERLYEAAAELPLRLRAVCKLTLEGKEPKEIATILMVSQRMVRCWLNKAVERLRRRLKTDGLL